MFRKGSLRAGAKPRITDSPSVCPFFRSFVCVCLDRNRTLDLVNRFPYPAAAAEAAHPVISSSQTSALIALAFVKLAVWKTVHFIVGQRFLAMWSCLKVAPKARLWAKIFISFIVGLSLSTAKRGR